MKKVISITLILLALFGPIIFALSRITSSKQPFSLDLKNQKPMTVKKYQYLQSGALKSAPKVMTSKMSIVPSIKAIYMNKVDIDHLIIGNQQLEDEFVSFLIIYKFNMVYMYDLSTILSTSQGRTNCGNFIGRLAALGIKSIGIGSSFDKLGDDTVSNSRPKFNNQMMAEGHPEKKFFGFNLELESWLYPATGTATWSDWQSIITKTKEYTNPNGVQLDAYIGNLKDKQGIQSESQLAEFIYLNFNTLLVHCYITSAQALIKDKMFNYLLTRLNPLGNAAIRLTPKGQPIRKLNVVIIFSASAGHDSNGTIVEVHMHDYFQTHSLEDAFKNVINSANSLSWSGLKGININGVCAYGVQEFYAVWPH